jgi:acetyltransferase-like isoleucine patch superfamily enzyme
MAGIAQTLSGGAALPRRARRALLFLPARLGYRHLPRIASWVRKWWTIARNPHATIRFGKHCYLGPGFSLHIPEGGEFLVGDGVEFRRNFRCEVWNGRVTIGSGAYMTYNVLIQCSTSITIGERCCIGHSSSVFDGSHRFRDPEVPFLQQGYDFRPITMGDDCVVHSLCTVLNDIGERAVIGANAVITRPVPAFTVAVGAPARPIDYFGPVGEEPEAPATRSPSSSVEPTTRAGTPTATE